MAVKKKGSAHNRPSTYNETLPRSSSLSSSWFTSQFFILIPTETNYFLKFYPFLLLCISLSFPIQISFFLSLSFGKLPEVYLRLLMLSSVFRGTERVWMYAQKQTS